MKWIRISSVLAPVFTCAEFIVVFVIVLFISSQIFFVSTLLCVYRTYADKLSPKVVQSLLDLLCSQLKNLLSQAGVMLMASFGEEEVEEHEADSKKADSNGENEKRDFRGNYLA